MDCHTFATLKGAVKELLVFKKERRVWPLFFEIHRTSYFFTSPKGASRLYPVDIPRWHITESTPVKENRMLPAIWVYDKGDAQQVSDCRCPSLHNACKTIAVPDIHMFSVYAVRHQITMRQGGLFDWFTRKFQMA